MRLSLILYLVILAGLAPVFTEDTVTIFRHGLNFARCTVTWPPLKSISLCIVQWCRKGGGGSKGWRLPPHLSQAWLWVMVSSAWLTVHFFIDTTKKLSLETIVDVLEQVWFSEKWVQSALCLQLYLVPPPNRPFLCYCCARDHSVRSCQGDKICLLKSDGYHQQIITIASYLLAQLHRYMWLIIILTVRANRLI